MPNRKQDRVILSEGIFDTLAIERACEDYDSVALLGHSLSDFKMKELQDYESFVLFPDPDSVGISGMLDVGKKLVERGKRVYMARPGERDPGDLSESTIKSILNEVEPFEHGRMQRMRLEFLCQS